MAEDSGRRRIAPEHLKDVSATDGNALSPIEQLRRKLLLDKDLLDYIPFSKVKLSKNDLMEGHSGDKIDLAQMDSAGDAGQLVTIWAFWSNKALSDELPDIHLGANTSSMVRYQFTSLGENVSFRKEFMPVKDDIEVLKAVLKCCLLVKQTKAPFEAKFSASFPELVRKACHMYKASTSHDTPQQAPSVQVPPMRLPIAETTMRPSMSLEGPTGQVSNEQANNGRRAIQLATPAKNTPPNRRKRQSSGARPASDVGYRRKRLKGTFDQETSSGSAQPQSRQVRHATVLSSVPQYHAATSTEPHPSSMSPPLAIRVSRAIPLNSSGSTSQPALKIATTNSDPSPQKEQAALTTSKSKEELEQYLALCETQNRLAETLKNINHQIDEAEKKKEMAALEDSRRAALARLQIKHQEAKTAMAAVHKRELQELTERHKERCRFQLINENAEIKEVNDAHISQQAKYIAEKKALEDDRRAKLQEKNAVTQELNRKRHGFTEEQLRLMFDESAKQLVKERMRSNSLGEMHDRKE
ncbi:hypothetical protein J1614_005322 [Plenodomus biglobosus]|nr:hypothetical protein J1614_005322 [Plenodomus biglobosus]